MPVDLHVLMAAYGGEDYIADQIESVLAQTLPATGILIRDDRSSDATPTIISRYVRKYPTQINTLTDDLQNLGPYGNFAELTRRSPRDSYLAYSDGDDVWRANKLALSMQAMQAEETRFGTSTPILVHTDLEIVSADLSTSYGSFWAAQRVSQEPYRVRRLLGENPMAGCTILMNPALAAFAREMPADGVVMHDWWCALIGVCFGRIVAVPARTVRYRQHGRNFIGARPWTAKHVLKRIAAPRRSLVRLRQRHERLQRQASVFLSVYGDRMDAEVRQLVALFSRLSTMDRIQRRWTLVRYGMLPSGLVRDLATLLAV